MNDTLKVAGRIGAELGAAKADLLREMERHRKTWRQLEQVKGLLREIIGALRSDRDLGLWQCRMNEADRWEREAAALSQQAEPTDTFTAVDMATAAAQGFRDGQAAVEPAPAQDEHCPECSLNEKDCYDSGCYYLINNRSVFNERDAAEAVACIDLSTDAGVVLYANRDHWLDNELLMTVAQHERIVTSLTRPAQTEQRPVAWVSSGPDGVEADWYPGKGLDTLPIGAKLYAAPVAQTAPQPEQSGLVEADTDDIVLTPEAQKVLAECIGAHAYVVGAITNGREDLALAEASKWVEAFREASADLYAQGSSK